MAHLSNAHCVVYRPAQHLEVQRTVHPHYLGVTAGDQQGQERECRGCVGLILLPDEMREDMPLQMVDIHQRLVYGQ